ASQGNISTSSLCCSNSLPRRSAPMRGVALAVGLTLTAIAGFPVTNAGPVGTTPDIDHATLWLHRFLPDLGGTGANTWMSTSQGEPDHNVDFDNYVGTY